MKHTKAYIQFVCCYLFFNHVSLTSFIVCMEIFSLKINNVKSLKLHKVNYLSICFYETIGFIVTYTKISFNPINLLTFKILKNVFIFINFISHYILLSCVLYWNVRICNRNFFALYFLLIQKFYITFIKTAFFDLMAPMQYHTIYTFLSTHRLVKFSLS